MADGPAPTDAPGFATLGGDEVALLTQWTEDARRANEGVSVALPEWWQYLAEHFGPRGSSLVEELPKRRRDEMWLACAAGNGDVAAARHIEALIASAVERAVRRYRALAGEEAELQQRLRILLLVATDERPPRILQYAGRGSLEGWVRVTAARQGLNLVERTRVHDEFEPAIDKLLTSVPEARRLRQEQRGVFVDGLRQALTGIDSRSRTLLRLHLVEGLSFSALGRAYAVDRSTASRWVAKAVDALSASFASAVGGLSSADKRDFLSAMQSGLEVSLREVLDHESE